MIPHFWHIIQGGYYLRQSNPLGHFHPWVYTNIDTIADHKHYIGDNPTPETASPRTSAADMVARHAQGILNFLWHPHHKRRGRGNQLHPSKPQTRRAGPSKLGVLPKPHPVLPWQA